jgi:crotonobetainyl-CoA:carnitine CoA-transferase CaiB-like acyl-CoA transferase
MKDLLVIELAGVLAGPDVGMFFAEQGAKVIKIENPETGGDVTRKWKLPEEPQNNKVSAYFSSVNYNKAYHFLNLKKENDYKQFIEWIKKADILITNFKSGDAEKLKADVKTIKKLNPSIIYAKITGFGEKSKRVAFDLVLQAECGLMSINGTKETAPLKWPIAIVDIVAAHQLKEGILIALYTRFKTNKGAMVEVSLYDSAISILKNQASNWLMTQKVPQPIGSLHPNIAPYGEIFETKDNQQIVLAVGSDQQFLKLLSILKAEKLAENEKYKTNSQRVKYRVELKNDLAHFFNNVNFESIEQKLLNENIPYGKINTIDNVFEQKSAQDLVLEEKIEGEETKRVKTGVFKINYF